MSVPVVGMPWDLLGPTSDSALATVGLGTGSEPILSSDDSIRADSVWLNCRHPETVTVVWPNGQSWTRCLDCQAMFNPRTHEKPGDWLR